MVISKNPVRVDELIRRFPQFFTEVIGDKAATIIGVAGPEAPQPGHALFLATPKAFREGINSVANVLVVPEKNRDEALAKRGDRTLLLSKQVEWAMAAVIHEFFLKTPYTQKLWKGVHPTAILGENVEIASDVRIGPNVVIGNNVKLAAGVFIGANSVIEDDSAIGERTVIHPLVYIGHSTEIGRDCEIHSCSVVGKEGYGYAHDERFNHKRIPHAGRVVIEDDVHLGASATIDRATFGETRIKYGAKFDNRVHIGHNSSMGKNSLVTAGFLLAGSSKVGANFVSGGASVVTGHIEVCDNVQISAYTAVGKAITRPGQYGGHPMLPLQQHIKMKVAMTHLHEMRRQLKQVLKKLGISEDAEADKD